MNTFLIDLRHSLRALLKAPGFLVASILSLALGIGVNIATFSALRVGLFPSLAWKDPKQLVFVGRKDSRFPMLPDTLQVSYPRFQLWQEHQKPLESLAAWAATTSTLGGPIEPRSVSVLRASPEFWVMLGVAPLLGRLPEPKEEGVLVVSHKLWVSALGKDPGAIGKSFLVGERSRTLIGILPANAVLMGREVFVPLELDQSERSMGRNFLSVTGRMRPGMSEVDVQTAFRSMSAQLQAGVATERTITAVPRPLLELIYGRFRDRQNLLAWITLFITILACLNLCTLVLGRGASRLRELSIRQALGARRMQLFLPLLSDLLLAAVPGVVLGWMFSRATARLLDAFVPGDFQAFRVPSLLDLGVAAGVAICMALAGTALPALFLPRMCSSGRLGGDRSPGGRARHLSQKGLVALQVGLALALLSGFALVYRSLQQLEDAPIGIAAEGRLLATLSLPARSPADAARIQREVGQVLDKIRALPGVDAAGATDLLPVVSGGGYNGRINVPGQNEPVFTYSRGATDGYFEAAGIPLLQGRTFRPSDLVDPPRVLIVSESFARDYFPGQNAIGRVIRDDEQDLTIIGVVGDARMDSVRQSGSYQTCYWPQATRISRQDLVVKASGNPKVLMPELRQILRAQWPNASLDRTRLLTEALELAYAAEPRRSTVLMGILAALALVLTLAGIYGVLSRQVLERRKEIGIRLALGERASAIVGRVVRQAMFVVGLGLVAGTCGALALGSVLRSQLYQVKPDDPRIHVIAVLVLASAALLACLFPALRAASLDPARVLREE